MKKCRIISNSYLIHFTLFYVSLKNPSLFYMYVSYYIIIWLCLPFSVYFAYLAILCKIINFTEKHKMHHTTYYNVHHTYAYTYSNKNKKRNHGYCILYVCVLLHNHMTVSSFLIFSYEKGFIIFQREMWQLNST
jgi:hypothetical protein